MASLSLFAQEPLEEQDSQSACGKYNQIISALPKGKSWIQVQHYYQYQGFWYKDFMVEGVIWAQQNFSAKNSDIFVASSPKCGTTWTKALAFAIMNRNHHHYSHPTHPLLHKNPHVCVPYVEFVPHEKNPNAILDSIPSPRLLSTHVPYCSLPNSIVASGSRIVYISRNPKDVFVSFYKFEEKIKPKGSQIVPLEEAFELFCEGISSAGPFWDHVLGYWEASLKHPDKVLFLRYEDMKRDKSFCVNKMAEFMGRPLSADEKSKGAVQDIIKLCSLENLSNLEVNKSGTFAIPCRKESIGNNVFFRQGKIGDSKNHLTDEMIKRLDQITERKLAGSSLKL